jgi:ComF family protein
MLNSSSHLMKFVSQFRDSSLALLWPQECRVCGAMVESWCDGVACARCWKQFAEKHERDQECVKCGLPLAPLSAYPALSERRCRRCDDFAFNCARSCGAYEGALRESVLRLKTDPQLAPRVCELLQATFSVIASLQPIESIIPVPLHASRQKLRGFNQAEIIAHALTDTTGLYADTASLIRERATEKHRAGMDTAARAKSLSQAFRVRAPRLIENRSVLVVDDVMTTGSTAHEIAETLLAGGARAVSVLTLARAISLFH